MTKTIYGSTKENKTIYINEIYRRKKAQ